MRPVVAGVDGGGTRMRAAILDGDGRELARVVGGGAVVSEARPGEAARAVAQVVRRAAEVAGAPLPLDTLWAGLAGAGREAARVAVEHALQAEGLARRAVVGTDAEAAFHDAFGHGGGILLLAGTGSVAWARSPDGTFVRAGGWGQWLGDEGSGWALGLAALKAVARAADGRGPATTLWEGTRMALGWEATTPVDALVPWVAGASKAEVASLAAVVAAAAGAGDAVASGLLDRAAGDLVAHVTALGRRLDPAAGNLDVALAGGLLGDEAGVLRTRVLARLEEAAFRVHAHPVDALRGAARLALEG